MNMHFRIFQLSRFAIVIFPELSRSKAFPLAKRDKSHINYSPEHQLRMPNLLSARMCQQIHRLSNVDFDFFTTARRGYKKNYCLLFSVWVNYW